MIARFLLLTILGFIIAFVQTGFIASLSGVFAFLDLVSASIVIAIFMHRRTAALFIAGASGLVADSFSDLPFGTHTFIFFLVVGCALLLFFRWFANRSPLSLLALTALAVLMHVLLTIGSRLAWFFATENDFFRVTSGVIGPMLFWTTIVTCGVVFFGILCVRSGRFFSRMPVNRFDFKHFP